MGVEIFKQRKATKVHDTYTYAQQRAAWVEREA
jgi:hypothetical protein